jgi:hypothetical protein
MKHIRRTHLRQESEPLVKCGHLLGMGIAFHLRLNSQFGLLFALAQTFMHRIITSKLDFTDSNYYL